MHMVANFAHITMIICDISIRRKITCIGGRAICWPHMLHVIRGYAMHVAFESCCIYGIDSGRGSLWVVIMVLAGAVFLVLC